MGSKDGISSILAGVQNGRISPECRSLDVCFASAVRKTEIIYRAFKADLKIFFLFTELSVNVQSFVYNTQPVLKRNRNMVLHFHGKMKKNVYEYFLLISYSVDRRQSMVEGYELGLSRNNLGILSELKVSLIGVTLMSL